MSKIVVPAEFSPLNLGPLPAEILRTCLGLPFPDGDVHFSIPAQRHAYDNHPDTYLTCVPFLSATVTEPTHVGQAPQHKKDGFELIKEIPVQKLIMLMAVVLRPTNTGVYLVKSVYPIDGNKLARRLRLGWVVEV